MIYRLGELFCGPGGIAWDATNAKIENDDFRIVHQWANDYDESTCETYRHNICPDNPETVYHGDIRTFDMSQLAPIDALAFGFPCNDYSVVGEQKGMDEKKIEAEEDRKKNLEGKTENERNNNGKTYFTGIQRIRL